MADIVIASDHAGLELKAEAKASLQAMGYKVEDLGAHDTESVDYPDYAEKLAHALKDGIAQKGVLICGTGIGISIAANRFSHIRAALCHDTFTAQMSREHNDANVLVLGARAINNETALACIDTFFKTDYVGGRHDKRVEKLGKVGKE